LASKIRFHTRCARDFLLDSGERANDQVEGRPEDGEGGVTLGTETNADENRE